MPIPDVDQEKAVREKAYFFWQRATEENGMEDEERVLASGHDANIPAMLAQDVPGG